MLSAWPVGVSISVITKICQKFCRKKRAVPGMLGLKSFPTAVVVISGIELAEKIKRGQFKFGKLRGRTATMPEVWQAALAA